MLWLFRVVLFSVMLYSVLVAGYDKDLYNEIIQSYMNFHRKYIMFAGMGISLKFYMVKLR